MKKRINKHKVFAFLIGIISGIKVLYDLWILKENECIKWSTIGLTVVCGISFLYLVFKYEDKKKI